MSRILLVEDEFLVRQVAFEELSDAGHCVVEVSSGDAAAAVIQQTIDQQIDAFDLVCTDIRMPGALDGWQLGAVARQLIPGVKVLYSSGYCDTQRPLEAGEAYLPKPYRLSDLLALVESLTGAASDAR